MSGHVLTLNAGSSSIKFGLFALADTPKPIATGLVERIGGQAELTLQSALGDQVLQRSLGGEGAGNHETAVASVLQILNEHFPDSAVSVVGHRVVHGGAVFEAPVIIDAAAMAEMERHVPFAPLHQPHNLAGIRAAQTAFPRATQVACFDTSFHRQHPWVNDVFALPREFYDKGVRRYGFHGLSYEYIAGELERTAPHLHAGRVVVAHLGNGASMCAMLGGRSVGSTMGFTALDGLPMGTRSGQLDPGVLLYLMREEGMNADQISDLLYQRSGLLGLSGVSNDMRALEAAGTKEAEEAIDYFVYRVRRELGALSAVLCGLDALVFCGGIGEHSKNVRERVCEGLQWIGIELDRHRNATNQHMVSTDFSRVRVLVIPTDEEAVIARAAARLTTA